MAQTNINIRMDSELKQQFDTCCREMGMSMTTAFNAFAGAFVRNHGFPFDIYEDLYSDRETLDMPIMQEKSVPNEIMSDINAKALLYKWTEYFFIESRYCVIKYYAKRNNVDANSISTVAIFFRRLKEEMEQITPVLEDLVISDITGIEEITAAIYGESSDEVYIVKTFNELYNSIDNWKESDMWNDFESNERLRQLFSNSL
ncbi:MAG: type II toxin-antitoxin system RelB/DinJ family antitoxin [Oscillospiraceae bacterium]|nr:type II toxin-antitoxin system RelB/DinJ family antitoxin [Oscillospiraceae bacterium]